MEYQPPSRALGNVDSWVTSMMVMPSALSFSNRLMMSFRRAAIESTGRFVGKYHVRVIGKCPSYGDALLLAAREAPKAGVSRDDPIRPLQGIPAPSRAQTYARAVR